MTTPDEPTQDSATGWPSDPSPVASGRGSADPAPLPGRDEDVEPAATQEPPYAEPDPAYVEPDPADVEPDPADVEPDPAPTYAAAAAEPSFAEPDPAIASGTGSVDVAPVPGRNEEVEPEPTYAPPDAQPEPPAAAAADIHDEPPVVAAELRSTRPLRSAPVLALLLVTVLMTAATAVVWYQVHRHDATENARRQGLETSRDAARVLFSYDYRTLPKDFAAGKAITTGKFQKQYADTTSKVVTPVATEKKAVVKAEVVTAGVVRATPDTVVTIVYVNQVTTSSLQTGPKVDLSRVRMTVKHVGGRWLISNVEAL